jgi:hypothetical protein
LPSVVRGVGFEGPMDVLIGPDAPGNSPYGFSGGADCAAAEWHAKSDAARTLHAI